MGKLFQITENQFQQLAKSGNNQMLNVPTQAALTGMLIAYPQPAEFIATRILQDVPVPTKTFKYHVRDLSQYTAPKTKVGRKGKINTVDFQIKELEASVEAHALKYSFDQSEQNDIDANAQANPNAPQISLRQEGMSLIGEGLTISYEQVVADMLSSDESYLTDFVDTPAIKWDDSVDLYVLFDDIINNKLFYDVNKIVMNDSVWKVVRRNPEMVVGVRGNADAKGKISVQEFQQEFNVELLIGGARRSMDSQVAEDFSDLSRIWGNNVQFMHQKPVSNTKQASATFAYRAVFGNPIARSWQTNEFLEGGEEMVGGRYVKPILSDKRLGYMLKDVLPTE